MIYLDVHMTTEDQDVDDVLYALEMLVETGPEKITIRVELTSGLAALSASERIRLQTLQGVLGPRLRLMQAADWGRPES